MTWGSSRNRPEGTFENISKLSTGGNGMEALYRSPYEGKREGSAETE